MPTRPQGPSNGVSPRISAIVNTLNEEDNLRSCLESLGWCDEIVVVDMHSTDSTRKIAKKFTSKVFLHPPMGFADPARQFAIERATGEWILILDADEMVPRALGERLREIAARDEADAIQIARKNFILGAWMRHTGFWPDAQLRFFKRGVVTIPGTIHTQARTREGARCMTIGDEDQCCIYHFAYLDSSQLMAKVDRYTTIEAGEMKNRGERFDWAAATRAARDDFIWRAQELRGIDDGDRGIMMSAISGLYRFLAWMKLWELEHNANPAESYREIREELLAQLAAPSANTGRPTRNLLGRLARFLSRRRLDSRQ